MISSAVDWTSFKKRQAMASLRRWVKHDESFLARVARKVFFALRNFEVPAPKVVFSLVYRIHVAIRNMASNLTRIFYWTPVFKSRLVNKPRNLYLYSGMPLLLGPLSIEMGNHCRVSGISTFSGRSTAEKTPRLLVGSNVDIGWQCSIAVGTVVVIEDNVRVAGRCMLAGYPGHPVNPQDRIAGMPETDDQVGDIVLENNVWLATDVKVMAGVRIGRNTIVAAGSVVTRDLPANVMAGGVPARVLRVLGSAEHD